MRGAFRKMRLALGTNAFGINQIELPAGASGPEHDEEDTTHEEVYVVLDGHRHADRRGRGDRARAAAATCGSARRCRGR